MKQFDIRAVRIGDAYRRGLVAYAEAGKLLADKKSTLKHGEWTAWLNANAEPLGHISERTAQRLMKLAGENPTLTSDSPVLNGRDPKRKLWNNKRLRGCGGRAPKKFAVDKPNPGQRSYRTFPIHRDAAHAFIAKYHRRLEPSWANYSKDWGLLGLKDDLGKVVGVGAAGRPSAHNADQLGIFQIHRIAMIDGVPHGAGVLIGAFSQIAKLLGCDSIQSFVDEDEDGTSYKGCGFVKADELTRPGRDGDGLKWKWSKDFKPEWHWLRQNV